MSEISKRYALLTRLPLLQGISSQELLEWEDALRLDLDEFPASSLPLIRQGDICSSLLCLMEGELKREYRSPDGIYTAVSHLQAPAIIEIDRLYGLTPSYEHTYSATTDVTLLNIRKQWINSHLMKSEVFRLNLLNNLSACAQRKANALKPTQTDSAESRIRCLLGTIFHDSKGQAELSIQMKELARYISASRLATSQVLNKWNDEGLICLGREHFTIPDLQALLENA